MPESSSSFTPWDLIGASSFLSQLKPSVGARGGSKIAKQFQETLAEQFKAYHNGNKAALTDQANHALDHVDVLENLFG